MRLDLLLVNKYNFETRQKAKYAIDDGLVFVNGKLANKCGLDVNENDNIVIICRDENYVSRAGFKLSKALNEFRINVENNICLDIGSSTGGFTDCLSQNNAKRIYATDVGTSQLHQSLRNKEHIIVKENLNFKDAKKEDFDNSIFDIVTIDVSFISLSHILNNLKTFIHDKTKVIALIKPQFELYEEAIKGKGLISKKEHHIKAINNVIGYAKNNSLYLNKLTYSPIKGEKKENIEFLALLEPFENTSSINIEYIVDKAHNEL